MSQNQAGNGPRQLPKHPRAPPPFPPPSCPRCSSGNTKFCYYNNYSVLQPRYLCKDCRRYWTHGGVVRNIPIRRKRSRGDSTSSCSQMSKPPSSGPVVPQPPLAWSMRPHDNPVGPSTGSSSGCVTFRPPISETMQSFGGGGFFNQTAFNASLVGGVNTPFGAVNIGFGGIAPPPSPPMFPHHSRLDGLGDYGIPLFQQPQLQPPPTLVLNSPSTTLTSPNNFLPIARNPSAAANVVSIKEWSELDDMDSEGDPLQSYNQSLP